MPLSFLLWAVNVGLSSWVKETAELAPYEALYLVQPFVNNFHKYCL